MATSESKAKFNFAASRLVNPPEEAFKLTEAQLWKGLEIKARDPQTFIASVTSCDVLSDSGDKIVRSVCFGNNAPMQEVIEMHTGTIAYFEAESIGTRITNVVSYDANDDLVLTFSFAGGVPGYKPIGDRPSAKELNKSVGVGVEHTIERIRELVKEGTITV